MQHQPDAPRSRHPEANPRQAALTVAGLVAVVGTLVALGVVPRWSGAVHLVALPPLDVIADLRWLLAESTSWGGFVGGTVGMLAVRVTALALVLGGGIPAWRPAVTLYGLALGPALAIAQLDFAGHAALYARIHAASLGLAALSFLILAPLVWQRPLDRPTRIHDVVRRGFCVEVTVPYALALLALGALVEWGGAAWVLPALPISALLTVVAASRLRSGAGRRPAVALGGFVLIVALVTTITLLTRPQDREPSGEDRTGSLVIMSGINSRSGDGTIFELDPSVLGYDCDQVHYFSYAGTGDGQPQRDARCPITAGAPYEQHHTRRPFSEQVALLEAQLAELPRPITVLAHSQAAWVSWQAATELRLPAETTLVLIGPFPASPARYPPPGEPGRGRVAGDLLRAIRPLPNLVDFEYEPDAPLFRDLLAPPDAASEVFERPLPEDVGALSATALPDLALMPDGWTIDGAVDTCPIRGAHPYLPVNPAFVHEVDRFLAGEPPRDCPPWYEFYRLAVQPLGVPPPDAAGTLG